MEKYSASAGKKCQLGRNLGKYIRHVLPTVGPTSWKRANDWYCPLCHQLTIYGKENSSVRFVGEDINLALWNLINQNRDLLPPLPPSLVHYLEFQWEGRVESCPQRQYLTVDGTQNPNRNLSKCEPSCLSLPFTLQMFCQQPVSNTWCHFPPCSEYQNVATCGWIPITLPQPYKAPSSFKETLRIIHEIFRI